MENETKNKEENERRKRKRGNQREKMKQCEKREKLGGRIVLIIYFVSGGNMFFFVLTDYF